MNKSTSSLFVIFTFCFLLPISYLYSQSGWGEDIRLTFDYAYNADPRAACCGDTVHLVWWKNYLDSLSNYREEIFYKRSTDAGLLWENDVRLTPEDSISAVTPSIAVWGNNVHVVWKEQTAYYFAICYRKSEDDGETWGSIDTILKTNLDGWYHPWITTDSNNVFLVTIKSGSGGQLVFVKSTDNGNSWLPSQEITRATNRPCVVNSKIDTSFLTVVYSITTEIYNIRSYSNGTTWSDSEVISENDGVGSQLPAMDTDDSSGIHVSWYDYKYSPYAWTGDIFYRVSRDSGDTWEEIDSLTVMHRAVASDILAESNNLHLVWEDDRNDFDDNFEIYYRMSTDLGQIWNSEERLTSAPYKSINPSLACGGDYLHLFWSDLRDSGNTGPWVLYYKRKDLSQAIVETDIYPLFSTLMFDVYPNPLSTTIDIRWQITDDSKKTILKIFDILGKEVMFYDLKGRKEITIDTQDLPCGVYFVQVKASEQSGIKKVIKVK